MSSSATRKSFVGRVKPTPVYIYFQNDAEAFFESYQQAVDFFQTQDRHEETIHGINRIFHFSSYFEKNWQGGQHQVVDKGLIFYVAPSIFGPSDGPNHGRFVEDELRAFVDTLSGDQQNYRVVVIHFNPPNGCTQNMVQFDSADFEFDSPELNEKDIVRVAITARKDFRFDDALKHKMLECLFSLDSMSNLVHSGWFLPAVSDMRASIAGMFSLGSAGGASLASQYFTKTPAAKNDRDTTTRCSLDERGTIFREQVRFQAFEKYSQMYHEAVAQEESSRWYARCRKNPYDDADSAGTAGVSGAPGLTSDSSSRGSG